MRFNTESCSFQHRGAINTISSKSCWEQDIRRSEHVVDFYSIFRLAKSCTGYTVITFLSTIHITP